MKDFDKEEINKAYDLYDEISCNFVEQDDTFASLEQRDFWAMLIYMNGNIIDDELSDQLCSSFDEFNKKIKENQVFYNTYFSHYCFNTDHAREFAYKEAKRFFTYREIDKEIKRNKKIKLVNSKKRKGMRKENVMKANRSSINCQNCIHKEKDVNFGLICQHKASMEDIEAVKEFYKINEVTECNYYEYDKNSVLNKQIK